MKILLLEDDPQTAAFIRKGLEQAGFTVAHSGDGLAGLVMAQEEEFDLAVVDVMLPRLDGFGVVRKLRATKPNVPVIILSARDAVEDRVKGLESGSDDYVTKPFAFVELLARIHALLRRATAAAEPTVLTYEDLTLDLLGRRANRGGIWLDLQPQEFSLLEFLMRNAGRVVSKTMIMEHVWEYNFDPQTNIVETRICRLRDKVDKPFPRKLIRTVRGFGYVLE